MKLQSFWGKLHEDISYAGCFFQLDNGEYVTVELKDSPDDDYTYVVVTSKNRTWRFRYMEGQEELEPNSDAAFEIRNMETMLKVDFGELLYTTREAFDYATILPIYGIK